MAEMKSRIYKVQSKGQAGKTPARLVEAISAAQALRYATIGLFECDVAHTTDVAKLMTAGVKVESAMSPEAE